VRTSFFHGPSPVCVPPSTHSLVVPQSGIIVRRVFRPRSPGTLIFLLGSSGLPLGSVPATARGGCFRNLLAAAGFSVGPPVSPSSCLIPILLFSSSLVLDTAHPARTKFVIILLHLRQRTSFPEHPPPFPRFVLSPLPRRTVQYHPKRSYRLRSDCFLSPTIFFSPEERTRVWAGRKFPATEAHFVYKYLSLDGNP